MLSKRMAYGLLMGSVLGIVCILGANLRSPEPLAAWYLFAFWLNRFLMGFVIAFLPPNPSLVKKIIRGVLVGLFISFTFYSATNYQDLPGFIVGGLYGVIIETFLHCVLKEKKPVSK